MTGKAKPPKTPAERAAAQRASQKRRDLKPAAVEARTAKRVAKETERRVRSAILKQTPPWLIGLKADQMPMTPACLRRLGLWLSTFNEAASFLGVSPVTLSRRMRDYPKLREAWDEGHEQARNTLRRKQLEVAFSDSPQAVAMLVHLGKTVLNQRDRVEHTGSDGGPIRYNHIRRTIVDPVKPEGEQEIDVTRARPQPPAQKPETRH